MKKFIAIILSTISLTLAACDSSNASNSQTADVTINISDQVLRPDVPATLFGFNIRWNMLQRDLWDSKNDALYPDVLEHLSEMPGTYYRYPGGLVANYFDWERSTLDKSKRGDAVVSRHDPIPLFGVGEYLSMLKQLDAKLLYTLNLTGARSKKMFSERSLSEVAASNARLARYLKDNMASDSKRIYQLGNELDRSHYEWSHDKYIKRSRASIDAILKEDEQAEFIAFLREFNWRYRDGRGGMSRWQDFTREVLQELPQVRNFSIHLYYDDYIRKGGIFFHIPDALARIDRVLKIAKETRPNEKIDVWITEHSKRAIIDKHNEQREKYRTTNLAATLSTADFLIAIAQIPEVKGASLQALNGVARQIFDARIKHRDRRPRPVFYAPRLLSIDAKGQVLKTTTDGSNNSEYLGGYDVRATAIQNTPQQITLWVVNRANKSLNADTLLKRFGGKTVDIQHRYIAGKTGSDANTETDDFSVFLKAPTHHGLVDSQGVLTLSLPPLSVSNIKISVNP